MFTPRKLIEQALQSNVLSPSHATYWPTHGAGL